MWTLTAVSYVTHQSKSDRQSCIDFYGNRETWRSFIIRRRQFPLYPGLEPILGMLDMRWEYPGKGARTPCKHTHMHTRTYLQTHSHLWANYGMLLRMRRKPDNSLQTIKPKFKMGSCTQCLRDIIVQYYFFPCRLVRGEKHNQTLFKGEGKTHCVRVENYRKKNPKQCYIKRPILINHVNHWVRLMRGVLREQKEAVACFRV